MSRVDDAIAGGMTAAEADVWDKVATAAGSYLRLTESEPHHGMEREEICHAFHVVQGWLAGRPFVRSLGAPVAVSDGELTGFGEETE